MERGDRGGARHGGRDLERQSDPAGRRRHPPVTPGGPAPKAMWDRAAGGRRARGIHACSLPSAVSHRS
jgi:hypothetical protein